MNILSFVAGFFLLVAAVPAISSDVDPAYLLQPGDLLTVSVWKEPDLLSEVGIRPDGRVSFPLAGDVMAAGRTVEQLSSDLTDHLKKFVPDALVTVSTKSLSGNRIYVIGRVTRPGDFVLNRPTDVMQALALAGGTTPFADTDSIRVLRHEHGEQKTIGFRYSDVERGRRLEQNITLRAGDTVVVP